MAKYRIYVVATICRSVGEVEASSKKEALEKAENLDISSPSLCHSCSEEWEPGDIQEILAEKEP